MIETVDSRSATMSLSEAASILHVSIAIVRQGVKSGAIPGIKLGSRWLILREPFELLIRTGRAVPQNGGER